MNHTECFSPLRTVKSLLPTLFQRCTLWGGCPSYNFCNFWKPTNNSYSCESKKNKDTFFPNAIFKFSVDYLCELYSEGIPSEWENVTKECFLFFSFFKIKLFLEILLLSDNVHITNKPVYFKHFVIICFGSWAQWQQHVYRCLKMMSVQKALWFGYCDKGHLQVWKLHPIKDFWPLHFFPCLYLSVLSVVISFVVLWRSCPPLTGRHTSYSHVLPPPTAPAAFLYL